jgi:hypothetical protein
MQKLNVQPTKTQAAKITDKLLCADHVLSDHDKSILYSYFAYYAKDEKSETARLKRFTKHLLRKQDNIYTLTHFVVENGFALISNGHFLAKIKTTLVDGTYNKKIEKVEVKNFEYPILQRIIDVCEKHVAVNDCKFEVIPGDNFAKEYCHIFTDYERVTLDNKYMSLFDLEKPLYVSSDNAAHNPIMQKINDDVVIIMPIQYDKE